MDEISLKILNILKNKSKYTGESLSKVLDIPLAVGNYYLATKLEGQVYKTEKGFWELTSKTINHLNDNCSGVVLDMDSPTDNSTNENFAFDSLQSIRNRLLDLTGRNRLLGLINMADLVLSE